MVLSLGMAGPVPSPSEAPRRRRRLFWKYVVVIVVLVTAVLAASSGVELWFTYRENQDGLTGLQREKAGAAAARIESFVREIERQMGWTTQRMLATGPSALEQRRLDFVRLQLQVPAITELTHIDPQGQEQLRISRLAMDVVGSGIDLSTDPRFAQAIARRVYHGPVTFRKESEPYMAIALAQSGGGVTVAEVNLKFIWDVITQIKIGKAGRAYVVDEAGNLIAHPDISLVLQKTSLATLPQVRAALAPGGAGTPVARDVQGKRVLTAHATIPGLRWTVFAEQPLEEALAPLQASIQRSLLLLAVGVALAIGASLLLARRMVRPIQALQLGAARIGGGELGHRIDVRTGDELETLARNFNQMTEHLQESYATLEQRVIERTQELTESLEQQTATGEILRVISQSPTDVQPVLDAVAESAARLCGAADALILRTDGATVRRVAHYGSIKSVSDVRPLTPGTPSGRAILERRTVHVEDIVAEVDRGDYADTPPLQRGTGMRTVLSVPLMREETVVGVITIRRLEVRAFTPKQVALVKTFADQAVIAIENVRLFTELESRNAALTESLEQQTATAEILAVISGSPTDVQPVFDAIVGSAVRLCNGVFSALFQYDGELVHQVAEHNFSADGLDHVRRIYPTRLTRGLGSARAILERAVVHIPDVDADPEYEHRELTRAVGFRSGLYVPMLKEGEPVGVIMVARAQPGLFSDAQITLLRTFADQAVIAIENVRLFKALEQRNAALTESLEQQTATAEILQVISGSPTDVQPVLEAVAAAARRFCGAGDAVVVLRDEESAVSAAHDGPLVAELGARRLLDRSMAVGRSILESRTVHIPRYADLDPAEFGAGMELARQQGIHAALAAPMLREGVALGAILLRKTQEGPFSPRQILLLETFAAQAVIAIENVRLFTELEARNAALSESLEQQTATAEILSVISSSQTDVQPVLDVVAQNAARVCGARDVIIHLVEGEQVRRVAHFGFLPVQVPGLLGALPGVRPLNRHSALGRAIIDRRTIQVSDMLDEAVAAEFPEGSELARQMGHRTVMATPLIREGVAIGAILMRRDEVHPFSDKQIALLETFADQAVIAIENVRLFTELQERTAQLQVANRHKDEFLANMSHELRTPLNAIIGFSEVMLERMFGDINAKQEEYLNDILSSGRHLLSLINDILDLSKIEAGKMELDVDDFNLAAAVDNALTLVHERAARRGLSLTQDVDERIGAFRGDERKIKQVLLNLLSNAIKFTPEGGRVDVRAVLKGDVVEVSVADTGVGIAPDDQEAVFEEFRQVGTDAARKHEGTGLGLALTRRFVELHGGNIWLESEVGVGSTFTFALPVRL